VNEIEQQSFRIPDDFSISIKRIISNLRNVVDQFGTNSKELVIELARRLDEEKVCERNKISRLIKYILKDKIREGKITAKWIEKCLPEEYKRDYSESEQNSLSRKAKKQQEMVIDNSGKAHAVRSIGFQKEQENLEYRDEGKCPRCSELEERCSELEERCSELEEALRKVSKISTAEQLTDSEIKVTISKDKYKEIKSAMRESGNLFYIIADSINRVFVRTEVDLKDDIIAD
jgi:hypothetical protein